MNTSPTYNETRINKRNLPDLLVYKFLTEYGYDHGPVIARAIVDDLLATLEQCYPERVPPRTIVWLAVRLASCTRRRTGAESGLTMATIRLAATMPPNPTCTSSVLTLSSPNTVSTSTAITLSP